MATAHNSIRAVVLLLVEKVLHPGERVVATLRRPEHLADLASKYPSTQLLVVELDVVKTEHIERAFEQTKKHFGRLDIVVNNAGYGLFAEIEVAPEEETRKQIEVLFWGPVHIIKRAIPFMRDINPSGQGGHILNISSSGGHQAHPGIAFYNAGKFALEGLTESLSKEMLPEWNIIKATIVEPGGFRTSWGHSSLVKFLAC
ncbi:unnamed protein product [Somion occarium]|uniref:NAD(P)-binding protein n=1 Tax=Somion occarium TaxID=3059160 RepID=A0ABP1DKR9_9APHY